MRDNNYVIVSGTDFSEDAVRALHIAFQLAREHAPSELHVVHALPTSGAEAFSSTPYPGLGVVAVQSLDEHERALVRHLDEELQGLPEFRRAGVRVIAHVLLDVPMLAITRLAGVLGANLIVVGSHGRHGVARWLRGSVAEGLVRQASCPVLVIPPATTGALLEPAIEPPCAHCLAARQASAGTELWCNEHRIRHGRRHIYFQQDRVGAETNFPLLTR